MRLLRLFVPVPLLFLALSGCDGAGSDDERGLVAEVSVDECASGRRWVGGDEESSRMHPGGDCIGCHTREGDGPQYLVAGTVHAFLGEQDDCFGISDATVEITDAEGRNWSLPTNDAGNFYLSKSDGPIAMPYQAAVVVDGVEQAMVAAQTEGSCATCHTADGANGAAGRVLGPM